MKVENYENLMKHPVDRPKMHVVQSMSFFNEFASCQRKSAHYENSICFSKWVPSLIDAVSYHLGDAQKSSEPQGPIVGFFGTRGPFEDQGGGPISGREVLSVSV